MVQIDLKALKEDRDQLWAEAVFRYRKGEQYWPDAELENEIIKNEQEARFDEDPWTGIIRVSLAGQTMVTVMQVAHTLGFSADRLGTRDARRISAILERLEWERRRTGKERWWVPKKLAKATP